MTNDAPDSRRKLISSWTTAFILTTVSALLGFIVGKFCIGQVAPKIGEMLVFWFQLIGTIIILLATLGFITWGIQTRGGSTTPEKINKYIFQFLYVFGSILIISSIIK